MTQFAHGLAWSTVLGAALTIVGCDTTPPAEPRTEPLPSPPALSAWTANLERRVPQLLADFHVPGLAVTVIEDHHVIYSNGFGIADLASREPVDAETRFLIGSITKQFTAALMVALEQNGQLGLDDPVVDHLPSVASPPAWLRAVTIRDLLAHRSGLGSHHGNFVYWHTERTASSVPRTLAALQPTRPLRTRFQYNNLGYAVLGSVVQSATGQSWADGIDRHLLGPLEMTRTTARTDGLATQTNVAMPHALLGKSLQRIPPEDLDNLGPAGGIVSSARDLGFWLRALMADDDGAKLPASVARTLRRPVTYRGFNPTAGARSRFLLHGFGFNFSDRDGRVQQWHAGGSAGYSAEVAMIPEAGFGIALLANARANGFLEALRAEAVDAFLEHPQDHCTQALADHREDVASQDQLRAELAALADNRPLERSDQLRFCGRFGNPLYGDVVVELQDGRLAARFTAHRDLSARLIHADGQGSNRAFVSVFSDPTFDAVTLRFQGSDDRAESFVYPAADGADRDYVFARVP